MNEQTDVVADAARRHRLVRVVLVEDHPAVREHLTAVLGAAGLDVIATAEDLRGGHEAVLRVRPDVVVVDSRLPDGGGIELCEMLLRDVPESAVVVHSGAVTGAETERALSIGVQAVVPKSLRGHDLVDAVRVAATRRRPARSRPGVVTGRWPAP